MQQSSAAHLTAVLVAYYITDRDCGGYSRGGAPSASAYAAWIRTISAAIADRPAVLILEPDAIAMATSGGCAAAQAASRYAMLADAVHTLKAASNVHVYLDAGHAGWIRDPAALVHPLRASGLADADGFAVNVANFETTARSIALGRRVSQLLGGAHFVVDTSRNGRGPLPEHSGYAGPDWCNPPGRALGRAPTTATGQSLVDAYLWVKYPGGSDGSCGLGDPPAGQWWADYALGLASRAR